MMINKDSPLVILGAGSIGERHIQVLQSLGYNNIYVYRQRNLPLREVDASEIKVFTDFENIDIIKPVAAFVTSPTAMHLEQALQCAKRGIHVLIEKPLSHTLKGIEELKDMTERKNVLVHIGYTLRFHPAFLKLKNIIDNKSHGKLQYFHTHWGEYLPDWHPWEDYAKSYASQKELGGGAALTLSHDIDIVNWLLGDNPVMYNLSVQRGETLQIDVETGVDIICKYNLGISGHIHLDFSQKVPFRTYHFSFEEAFIRFNYFDNEFIIQTVDDKEVIYYSNFKRNDMFRDQTTAFFNTINSVVDLRPISNKNINDSRVVIEMCTHLNN
jgi:predicted dehydrogenase